MASASSPSAAPVVAGVSFAAGEPRPSLVSPPCASPSTSSLSLYGEDAAGRASLSPRSSVGLSDPRATEANMARLQAAVATMLEVRGTRGGEPLRCRGVVHHTRRLPTLSLHPPSFQCLGEDTGRQGLAKTPSRVAKALLSATAGSLDDPSDVVGDALFDSGSREMVTVVDIPLYSLCEHHMLPFYGRVHIAYLPAGKVVGLSKLARIADVFAKRLQIQERLTAQVAQAVQEITGARGTAVCIEAAHMCMSSRGVSKPGAETITTTFLGELSGAGPERAEFLAMVGRVRR